MLFIQTLSQLCTFDYGTKAVKLYNAPWYVQDKPRFEYRGLLLGEWSLQLSDILSFSSMQDFLKLNFIITCFADTSRHYLPIEIIKQVIESMSYAKLVRYANLMLPLFLQIIVFSFFFPDLSILMIAFSRMSSTGTSQMKSHFHSKSQVSQICGKGHIQNGSDIPQTMLLKLLSKFHFLTS